MAASADDESAPPSGPAPHAPADDVIAHCQGALRAAWQRADAAADPRGEPLAEALRAVAREARARGAPVTALLRALDRLAWEGGAEAGVTRVRAWAGTEVIRAYHRDD